MKVQCLKLNTFWCKALEQKLKPIVVINKNRPSQTNALKRLMMKFWIVMEPEADDDQLDSVEGRTKTDYLRPYEKSR